MPTLDDISASQFLNLVESGEVNLNDYLEPVEEHEKIAYSLEDLSTEDLIALVQETGGFEKEASDQDFDLNELSVEEFMHFAADLEEEMIKEASDQDFDLNELSVEEFMHFAADLEEHMIKEAASAKEVWKGLQSGANKAKEQVQGYLSRFKKKPAAPKKSKADQKKEQRAAMIKKLKTGAKWGAPPVAIGSATYMYKRRNQ